MISIIGSIITSLAVSVFIFPILVKYSRKKKIWDEPNHRRIHTRLTPSIGGVAIFFGFLTATLIWLDIVNWPELKTVLGILFIVFILGLCDDLVHIKPSVKILGQTIAGSLAFFLLNIKLDSLYGFLSDYTLNAWLSYPLTIFTIIIVTNSFNLIDGIDGLAGTFSGITFIFFGTWFYFTDNSNYSILCFALLGAIIGFLIFNWEPSKIFMGDTGALLIGMMLALITIKFININYSLRAGSEFKFESSIFTALCIIIIPVIDTTRVIVTRLSQGISPLAADKRHVHHSLIRLGLSHAQAVILLSSIQVLCIAGTLVLRQYKDLYLAVFFLVFIILFNLVLNHFIIKKIS